MFESNAVSDCLVRVIHLYSLGAPTLGIRWIYVLIEDSYKAMSSQRITHILTLHLYQPPSQLQQLLQEDEAELQRILKCYERIARHAHKYVDVAQLHVIFSVPLIQQLNDPAFIKQTRHLEDVPAILESFRSAPNIEFIASGYQHAPLPLIPAQDWDAQLRSELSVIEEIFGHRPKGYYPPGGLFDEALIPHLIAAGYQFAMLPKTALVKGDNCPVDPYRVYQLKDNFIVIPIDDGFSHAQEHFVEVPWFADEVINGIRIAPESASPYLVTTCSDGENGEWFRRLDEENGYFGHFFIPYMEFCETGEYPIRPANVVNYLHHAEPEPAQLAKQDEALRDHPVLSQLKKVSELYWNKLKNGVDVDPSVRELILRAEGSCFVLDQDSDYKKMATLLHSILDLLETPKANNDLSVSGDSAVAMPDPQADKPLSTQPPKKQASVKKLAASAKSRTNETTKKRSSSKKKALTRKESVSANKVATSSRKSVKTRQSTSSTVTKTGTARTASSSLPTEGDTTISENTPLKEMPIKTRKKSTKTSSNRKEGHLLTSS
jgi:peptidoglycan/xylan/chitin deacetylase (PgdA/CDA1 family)